MQTITQTDAQVISPCVRNCCLNRADYCLGCKRHIDEIVGWRALSEAQRLAIMAALKTRDIRD